MALGVQTQGLPGFLAGQQMKQQDRRTQQSHDVDMATRYAELEEKIMNLEVLKKAQIGKLTTAEAENRQAENTLRNVGLEDDVKVAELKGKLQQNLSTMENGAVEQIAKSSENVVDAESYKAYLDGLKRSGIKPESMNLSPSWQGKKTVTELKAYKHTANQILQIRQAEQLEMLRHQNALDRDDNKVINQRARDIQLFKQEQQLQNDRINAQLETARIKAMADAGGKVKATDYDSMSSKEAVSSSMVALETIVPVLSESERKTASVDISLRVEKRWQEAWKQYQSSGGNMAFAPKSRQEYLQKELESTVGRIDLSGDYHDTDPMPASSLSVISTDKGLNSLDKDKRRWMTATMASKDFQNTLEQRNITGDMVYQILDALWSDRTTRKDTQGRFF